MLRVDDRGVGGSTGDHGDGRPARTSPATSWPASPSSRRRTEIDPKADRPDRPQRGRAHRRRWSPRESPRTSPSSSCWPAPACRATRSSTAQGRLILKAMGAEREDRSKQAATLAGRSFAASSRPRRTRRPPPTSDRGARQGGPRRAPRGRSARRSATRTGVEAQLEAGPDPLVPLLPDLRPPADAGEGQVPGPGAQRREGPPGPAQGEPRRDREGPQGRRQHPGHDQGAARPEPPVPDLQDRRAVRVRPDRGDDRPGGV